ncbi:MAG: hypothetical protein HY985_13785 [Magnetospirillum sp.]|nr:hypothetical protein [Magnetospirillum sp.]
MGAIVQSPQQDIDGCRRALAELRAEPRCTALSPYRTPPDLAADTPIPCPAVAGGAVTVLRPTDGGGDRLRFFRLTWAADSPPHCAIHFAAKHEQWSPAAAYPDITPLWRDELAKLGFAKVTAVYSSLDFLAERNRARRQGQAGRDRDLAAVQGAVGAPWLKPDRHLRGGLNFAGTARLPAEAAEVATQLGFTAAPEVVGAVAIDESGIFLELACSTSGAAWTTADGSFSVSVRELRLRLQALDRDLPFRPAIGLSGSATFRTVAIDADMLVDTANRMLMVEAWVQTPSGQGLLDSLMEEGERGFLRNVFRALPDLKHARLAVGFDRKLHHASLELGYPQPITIIDGFAVEPWLTVDTAGTLDSTRVAVGGVLTIGATRFRLSATIPDGSFAACLAPGSVLALPSVLGDGLGKVVADSAGSLPAGTPPFAISAIDLTGNLREPSFEFDIRSSGVLSIPFGGQPLLIRDVDFQVGYQGPQSWRAALAGTIVIDRTEIDLHAALGQDKGFRCTVRDIRLAAVAAALFPSVELPAALKAFSIKLMYLSAQFRDGASRYEFAADFGGNEDRKTMIGFRHIDATSDGRLKFGGDAFLRVDGCEVGVKISYAA